MNTLEQYHRCASYSAISSHCVSRGSAEVRKIFRRHQSDEARMLGLSSADEKSSSWRTGCTAIRRGGPFSKQSFESTKDDLLKSNRKRLRQTTTPGPVAHRAFDICPAPLATGTQPGVAAVTIRTITLARKHI